MGFTEISTAVFRRHIEISTEIFTEDYILRIFGPYGKESSRLGEGNFLVAWFFPDHRQKISRTLPITGKKYFVLYLRQPGFSGSQTKNILYSTSGPEQGEKLLLSSSGYRSEGVNRARSGGIDQGKPVFGTFKGERIMRG